MYAIYGNIYHQYTPNVSIYTIHGSYGFQLLIPTEFSSHVWPLWLLSLAGGGGSANRQGSEPGDPTFGQPGDPRLGHRGIILTRPAIYQEQVVLTPEFSYFSSWVNWGFSGKPIGFFGFLRRCPDRWILVRRLTVSGSPWIAREHLESPRWCPPSARITMVMWMAQTEVRAAKIKVSEVGIERMDPKYIDISWYIITTLHIPNIPKVFQNLWRSKLGLPSTIFSLLGSARGRPRAKIEDRRLQGIEVNVQALGKSYWFTGNHRGVLWNAIA